MRKIQLVLLFASFCLISMAQQSVPANEKAVITINGQAFHTGDAVSKESLKKLFPNSVTVASDAKAFPIKATSFECVISLKEGNGIWKFDTENTDGNPGRFREILEKAKPSDLVFIDVVKYTATTSNTFPTQFTLNIK